ncbi:MAG TPA: DNA-processing protein DprA [Longilinea sp.]|nr:DNA-processing protein DprA [Longilinea sp.]
MDTSLKQYWVGFNLVRGIGPVRLHALLEYFGSIEMAWQAPYDALRNTGLPTKTIENMIQVRAEVDLERIMDRLEQCHVTVYTWEDEDYPRLLKEIDQPPPVLYVRGSVLPEDEWAVGVVGTRRMTAYGKQVTEQLAAHLAMNGVTLVSGLARGVDAVAHQTALHSKGRTIAVLGCGVDVIYPPENRKLADQIMEAGALISEYPLGTQPDSANFPPRNRIISGLSKAVVVVEAGDTSGALITATFAAEQGRDVFAVPGMIVAPQSKGTNRLIRDGARPLLDPNDVIEALHLDRVQEYKQARLMLPENEVEVAILSTLSQEPLHVDEIQVKSGITMDKLSAALVMMELKGMVRQVNSMTYSLVQEIQADYEVETNG